jgi:mRNA interferase RelE/StbE
MAYNITISKQAVKALEKTDEPYYSNIKDAIYNLDNNPRSVGYIKLKNRDAYRIRVANYRIIYQIFDKILLIDIINIGHRKDIY